MISVSRVLKTRKTHRTRKTRLFDAKRPMAIVWSYHTDQMVRVYVSKSWRARFCESEGLYSYECIFVPRTKPQVVYWCEIRCTLSEWDE